MRDWGRNVDDSTSKIVHNARPPLPVVMSSGPVQQEHRTSSGPEGSSDKVINLRAAVNLGSSQRGTDLFARRNATL
jgi:hypothetical protein